MLVHPLYPKNSAFMYFRALRSVCISVNKSGMVGRATVIGECLMNTQETESCAWLVK